MASRTCTTEAALLLLPLLLCCWTECTAIRMEGGMLEAVVVAENGTVDEIILDCPYILESDDDKSGLVIKWYKEDYLYPVYQWIPNGQIDTPQLSAMDDTIDTTYEHSSDPLHRHRALRLRNPRTRHTGRYSCEVSTYFDEKKIDIELIIYSLPSTLSLFVEELSPSNLSVVCVSEPSYPEPLLELAMLIDGRRTTLDAIRDTTWSDGLYNTTLDASVDMDDLAGGEAVQFQCQLSIPLTNLSVVENVVFGEVTAVESPDPISEDYADYDQSEVTTVADASTHRSTHHSGRGAAAVPCPLLSPTLQLLVAAMVVIIAALPNPSCDL